MNKIVFTNSGKQQTTYALGSQPANNFISYYAVGSGSAVPTASDTTMIHEWKRFVITGSPDFGTRTVTFIGDLSASQASGLILQEFGLLASGVALQGSIWLRESIGSLTFDGTNELRIETTLQVI